MGYEQLTIFDWLEMKESLKRDLMGVSQSFVRIGYKLRQIEEQRLYEKDGYKSIADFAKAEYGLTASVVSRFMAINRRFSLGGYSENMSPEFAQMGSSKLSEMLALPDSDLQMIEKDASREGIRELKSFNKQEPEKAVADDIAQLLERFYEENPDLLKELFKNDLIHDTKRASDLVNPGGNKVFRKGLYFLMMYETGVKYKKYGQDPDSMSWEEFFGITENLFAERMEKEEDELQNGEDASNGETEGDTGDLDGEPERTGSGEQNTEESEREVGDDDGEGEEPVEPEQRRDSMEPVCAGDGEESTSDEDADGDPQSDNDRAELEGPEGDSDEQGDVPEDHADTEEQGGETEKAETDPEPEQKEEPVKEQFMNAPEEKGPFGTRQEYMESLAPWSLAEYLVREFKSGSLNTNILNSTLKMKGYLVTKVNEEGGRYE